MKPTKEQLVQAVNAAGREKGARSVFCLRPTCIRSRARQYHIGRVGVKLQRVIAVREHKLGTDTSVSRATALKSGPARDTV